MGEAGLKTEPSQLGVWRKKLTKAEPQSIQKDEWSTVYNLLLSEHSISARTEQLSLLIVTLRQLRRALGHPSANAASLSDDFHQHLAPAFVPSAKPCSIADILLESLDSNLKTEQSKAAEALTAASHLSTSLLQPSPSSSTTSNFLLPLFRYIVKQGVAQRRSLVALSSIIYLIPVQEVPEDVLQRLLKDLDVLEFSPIRSSLIVTILQARWTEYLSTHEGINDESFQRIVYQPLLPYFDPSTISTQTWQNVQRYLYPALSVLTSPSGRGFLAYLEALPAELRFDDDAMFECWITIASAAVQSKQLGIRSVDQERLKQAIRHADFSIRLKAFLIYSQNEDILEARSVAGIKAAFEYNAALHIVGQRSEFGSALYTFFTHLQQETLIAERAVHRVGQGHKAIKGVSLPLETDQAPCPRYTIIKDPEQALRVALDLRRHIFDHWVLPGLSMALRRPVAKILVALIVFRLFVDVFGKEDGVQEMVFSKETVDLLLACQSSEFTEVRSKARGILDSATIPLPTYENLDAPASQALLASALSDINQPRKTQAEAGRAILGIFFEKLVVGTEGEVLFVTNLVDQLDQHLVMAETDLVNAMEKAPLHGLLTVLRDLVQSLTLGSSTSQNGWRPVFHRLLSIIDRVWAVTRPVISLKAAPALDGTDRPDHEIARAYEVAGDGEVEGDDDEGLDITSLLSGCWRATTGAGELLSAIIATPFNPKSTSSGIWNRAEVDQAGHRFLTWMHEVRHRGTFTKLATAFASLVQAIKRVPDLRDLCTIWLDHELRTVRDDALSTTRRSAALPYSILSIITADQALSDRGVNELIKLADVRAPTNDVTKVHAFNVLQVVLPDAKQAKFLDRYFENAVMTAIGAFESPNWNVRNVGLILFATLIHRSLNLAKSQDLFEYRTNSATRQTFIAWHTKYPSILPYLTRYLETHQSTSGGNKHSPLFPILIIVRSLRYTDSGSGVQKPLVSVVESLLGSREWQVRKVAAQALTSLLSPQEALYRATNFTASIDEAKGNNEIHGRYMLLSLLFEHVIDWTKVDNLSKKQIEQHLLSALGRHGTSPLLDSSSAVVHSAAAYIKSTSPMSPDLEARTSTVAKAMLFSSVTTQRPIQGTQLWLSAAYLLDHCPSNQLLQSLLDFANFSPDFQQLPALWALQGSMGSDKLGSMVNSSIFSQVIELARSKSHDNAVRITAMDALRSVKWDLSVVDAVDVETRRAFVKDMSAIVRGTKYVPVREAALPALAWGVVWVSSDGARLDCEVLSKELLKSSHEDESQPARESALTALKHLIPYLLPAKLAHPEDQSSAGIADPVLCVLHQTLDRLLNDDDEELRDGAADIVRKGLGLSNPICRDRADELWCQWTRERLTILSEQDKERWVKWLTSQLEHAATHTRHTHDVPKDGISQRQQTPQGHNALFTVEPSNLFRDALADSRRAATILGAL